MTPEEGMWTQIEMYRRMTPQERLQISFELDDWLRTFVHRGVKFEHPDWDERQVEQVVRRRFFLGAGIHSFPQGGKQ
jgi:hypothetical protein